MSVNDNYRIESLLSARLFLVPQIVGERIYFLSNLSGHISLYAMDQGGSVPEPLLPPHIALQNPHLMEGRSFIVFPQLEQILVLLDSDGDEKYKPMIVPTSGGYPKPIFEETLAGHRANLFDPDLEENIVYIMADADDEPVIRSFWANVETGEIVKINESMYAGIPAGRSEQRDHFILLESYGAGDNVLFTYRPGIDEQPVPFYGKPLAERKPDEPVEPTGFNELYFVEEGAALLFHSILFDDRYGLGRMSLARPEDAAPVPVKGLVHTGEGEMGNPDKLKRRAGDTRDRYLLPYNIDGASWLYEAEYDEEARVMTVLHTLVGQGRLANGVLESVSYDAAGDRFVLSFSTATSPTQLYTIEGAERDRLVRHTNERILGISPHLLAAGEDYPFTSYDGLRISARLYLPAEELGYEGPRPLVYYIHGGPQSQERPDFAWFSMPLIQFLTLNGMAVFVPNVRGSTGYGFAYMKQVVRDWGGADRLDHVHAITDVLAQDKRLDTSRTAIVGRSYGGFMTLTLAARHPELWAAAVDMFGPYDLLTFADRVPETWKPFMAKLVGDPATEADFLRERSPRTYIDGITAPLLVIQGNNDPRVREVESRELVEHLRDQGKEVDYLMLPDEGHDVLKFGNRVLVYNAITDFFKKYLRP
jgi:pimeloyl-ACP methyl ester carboxylesterase